MYKEYDFYFNYAMVGPPSVGKSSIIQRYVHDAFDTKTQNTIGYDFRIKELVHNGKTIKLQIYDTAGQERYRSIASSYLKNAHAVFIVYDVADKNTFQDLKKVWYTIVSDNIKSGGVISIIVNKCDSETDIPKDEEVEFFKDKGLKWYRTSAKTGLNINQMMKEVASELINKQKPPELQQTKVMKLQASKHKQEPTIQKKKCC